MFDVTIALVSIKSSHDHFIAWKNFDTPENWEEGWIGYLKDI